MSVLEAPVVAQRFARAADSYNSHAQVQRSLAELLREQWPSTAAEIKVMDLGCGTGQDSAWLARQCEQLHLVDVAKPMLIRAREQAGTYAHAHQLSVHELDQINACVDVVWSNCMLQWARPLVAAFAQVQACLAADGTFLGSLITHGSLAELSHAWQQAGWLPPLIDLPAVDEVGRALSRAGFRVVWDQELSERQYVDGLVGIRDHLRGLGATKPGEQRGLKGREALRRLQAAVEKLREPEGVPLTWHGYAFRAVKA